MSPSRSSTSHPFSAMTTSRIQSPLLMAMLLLLVATVASAAEAASTTDQTATVPGSQIGEITIIKTEPGKPAKEIGPLPPKPPRRPSTNEKITNVPLPDSLSHLSKPPTGPVGWTTTPLGLPRLAPDGFRRGKPVATTRFEVDQLSAGNAKGLRKSRRSETDYLEIDAGKSWSRNLRGKSDDVGFVSFVVYGGAGTEIHIGGARLRIQPGTLPGFSELSIGEPAGSGGVEWKSLNYHVNRGLFGGKELAMLPVFTVRLDAANALWDLYSGIHQVVHNRPLIATSKGDARKFAIEAGATGAWLCGAVISDENPLFDDDNANGVDDEFEMMHLGALQAGDAPASSRRDLADEWRISDPRSDPPIFFFLLPQPDSLIPAQIPAVR